MIAIGIGGLNNDCVLLCEQVRDEILGESDGTSNQQFILF
jgi:hypothetical protein